MDSTILVIGENLTFHQRRYRCAIGKGKIHDSKKEGDGRTPTGRYPLRECWYRADRLAEPPETSLKLKVIGEDDGWCDDPEHPAYNTHVKLPFDASHEKLWRDDHMYDVIVPLGYNDMPPVAGLGSAIFFHVARPGYEPTEGCVALALEDLLSVLKYCTPDTIMEIRAAP